MVRLGALNAAAVKGLLQQLDAACHGLTAEQLTAVLHLLGNRQAFAPRGGAQVQHPHTGAGITAQGSKLAG